MSSKAVTESTSEDRPLSQLEAKNKHKAAAAARLSKRSKQASSVPKPLHKNLSPELDSVSSPLTDREQLDLSTIPEESDLGNEQIAPSSDPTVATTGEVEAQLEKQPRLQMIVNSPSPVQFFENEKMPHLKLGPQSAADHSDPPLLLTSDASAPAKEVPEEEDNDEFNPEVDDARTTLEAIRASSSKYMQDSVPGIHLTPTTRDLACSLHSYIALKKSLWKD